MLSPYKCFPIDAQTFWLSCLGSLPWSAERVFCSAFLSSTTSYSLSFSADAMPHLLSGEQTQKLWDEDSVYNMGPQHWVQQIPLLKKWERQSDKAQSSQWWLVLSRTYMCSINFSIHFYFYLTHSYLSCLCLICMHTASDGQSKVTSRHTSFHHVAIFRIPSLAVW